MSKDIKKKALIFILFLGIISFFSDFTHEGARSIYGPYLNILGASAFVVAFAAGLGEFIGQALRIFTGIVADKTKKYWTMMIIGYAVNLLAIPLLAFVTPSIWWVAVVLILVERIGKAVRAPAKSALTSFTAPHLGAGKAFAINEALDQFGAFLGPLVVFFMVSSTSGDALSRYQMSFLLLGIFAIITLIMLFVARFKYPNPDQFEAPKIKPKELTKDKQFWIYMAAISFLAMGFVDYPIIAYHLDSSNIINVIYIPLLYSIAMGVDAIAALIFGHLFDKKGLYSLILAIFIALFSTPLLFFFNETYFIIIGVVLWGVGMGAQESILKAVIAKMVAKDKRATGYGIFSSVFGLFWFLGSLVIGFAYARSLIFLIIFSITMELLAIVILFILMFYQRKEIKET
ncbi:MAG: MFS transporter [Acholeplasmataceae bacterium]|nr:MFS transporter [Acholeplasmataceae bacterium]